MSSSVLREIECKPSANEFGRMDEIRRLLTIFAALFIDNVRHLDDTVANVTSLIMREGRPDNDLIVTLQSFDRLKQEFEALGGALAQYAEAANPNLADDQVMELGRAVVNAITLADLKARMLAMVLGQTRSRLIFSEPSADEVDIDVVF